MSLRDEIAQKLFFEEHGTMEQWGREDQYYNPPYYALADALMPLVERAVDQAASEGWHCGRGSDPDKGEMSQHEADAIVARVTGKGDL